VSSARGFTLLELLAAMAVLAVLGTLGFRGLSSVLDAEERLQAETRLWDGASLLFSQMSEDAAMAVERTTRDSSGQVRPPLQLRGAPDESAPAEDAQLVMSRLGNGDGAAAQSAPRRVGYRMRGSTLEYLVWPALDAAPGTAPAVYPILEHVSDLQLQALDLDGGWATAWPTGALLTALPRAIRVRIVLGGGEDVFRILPLR
jgi:general secretion pathway protein J